MTNSFLHRRTLLGTCALSFLGAPMTVRPRVPPLRAGPELFGIALGIYPQEARLQGWQYPPDPTNLLRANASAVLLTPTWSLPSIDDDTIQRDAHTPTDDDLHIIVRRAHRLGLRVALMPFIRVLEGGPGQWRGALRPRKANAFWNSYNAFIEHYARAFDVHTFAIGTEMTSLTGPEYTTRWRQLAQRCRSRTSARLAYISNHDALSRRAPFPFVDTAGVSAYFPVPHADSWQEHARTLRRFKTEIAKPLVLFEVGFPSRRHGHLRPWDDVSGTSFSVSHQVQGYRAVTRALRHARWLDGLFFWNWYGDGNPYDRSFALNGKAVESIAASFLEERQRLLTHET